MENKKAIKFTILNKEELKSDEMINLKGGAVGSPEGCVDFQIGAIICTTVVIGSAQPDTSLKQ